MGGLTLPDDSGSEQESRESMDRGSLITGWFMLIVSMSLFILSLAIFLFGLEEVFTNKRFPNDMDTPCFLAFLVMGIIFLNLGIVYRDLAVHPEIFQDEIEEKSVYETKKEEWENIKKSVKGHEKGMNGVVNGVEGDET